MKIFIDSADIEEIKAIKAMGILDGVTTNPTLIKKAVERYKAINIEKYIVDLLKLCSGARVSLEVVGNTFEQMISEGRVLYHTFKKYADIFVKIPVNPCMEKVCTHQSDGIQAIKKLVGEKIPINCTLIFTPEQALLAVHAGAQIVSPFLGREDDYIREINRITFSQEDYFPQEGFRKGKKILEDNGIVSGIDLLKEIVEIFRKQKVKSEILAASVRTTRQFREAALAGADIITLPYRVIENLLKHPKTIEGMKQFTHDADEKYKKLLG